MGERIDGGDGAGVVEATGFAVLDGEGRRRAFLGCLPGEHGPVGLALYDQEGRERVSLLLGELGPVLAFAVHGDVALMVGVDDPGGEIADPGPYLVAMGLDGRVAWRVQVGRGGVVCEP